MTKYNYGNEISFDYSLIKPEDYNKLQAFSCGNKLDYYIHNEIITYGQVNNDDALLYKIFDSSNDEIIGIVSLAASGIIHEDKNYMHLLPAVKIDVFAIDLKFQKLHYELESKNSPNPNDHYYFSDEVLGTFISKIRKLSETDILANYILLYADKDAYRFYQRNGFLDFEDYMHKENNIEINKNIPMYMQL